MRNSLFKTYSDVSTMALLQTPYAGLKSNAFPDFCRDIIKNKKG